MIRAVGVAIPARDEAASIGACIDSIAVAAGRVRIPVVVAVAADQCIDGTAAVAAAAAERAGLDLEVIACRGGSAGAARRVAGEHVAERLTDMGIALPATWIASTDADSTVPSDWLRRQLAWAALGLDAVAGLVDVGPDVPAELRARFHRATTDEGGRGTGHRHVHGANLGVRGSALHAAGGFPDVALAEDHALWERLAVGPARVLGVADTTVITSGRLRSHTVGGFATYMAELAGQADGDR